MRRKYKTRSRKAGLRFSVASIHRKLKSCTFAKRISDCAPVYLGAVLEYMTAEVLEIAGVVAKQNHHPEITPHHILIAAKEDHEMEQLLEGVIVSEGGVLRTEDQPKLSLKNEMKDKIKAKQAHKERKRKLQDPGRLHIGCPTAREHSHKNKHEKRKESVKNGVDGKSSSFTFKTRISFQRTKSKAEMSSFDGNGGDKSNYSGEEFVSDDSSFKDHRGIGLAFRMNNKVLQTKISSEVKSSGREKTAPLQKDRKENGRNLPLQNNSFNHIRQSSSITSTSLGKDREYYKKMRNGNSSIFEENEGIKNDCQICPKYVNKNSSVSFQKQPNVGWKNENVLNSRDLQPKNQIPDPENFSTSNMSFADFVLKRSTIPPDLLNVSISGTFRRNGRSEDGCKIQSMNETHENWQTSKKNLVSDWVSKRTGQNNKLKNVHISTKKAIPNKVSIENKENMTNRLRMDLKIVPKLDSSETLMNTSVSCVEAGQNESESIVPKMYNREKSLPQDGKTSSRSNHLEQSVSCPSTLERKTCPKSIQKYEIGDLVWGRFTESSFYPAIVINDPDGKYHSKVVRNNLGLSEGENSLQYHLQFLYTNCERSWIPSKQIMPYKGITKYEEIVKMDVDNMNIYKPETSALKLQWRGAVLFAKKLEGLARLERIRKCDEVKLKHFDFEKNENKNVETEFKDHLLNEGESNIDRLKEVKDIEMIQMTKDQNLKTGKIRSREDIHEKRVQKEFKTSNITLNGNIVTDGISYSYSKRITNVFDKTEDFDNPSSQRTQEVSIDSEEKRKQTRGTLTTKMLELVNTKSEDEFPRLGDLVWAQVPGFLHWPALVTKSADGIFRKESNSPTQTMFHVQFLNSNGETSWVDSVSRFVGVDQFKETEKFRKIEQRSLEVKWNKAVRDAEHTIGLTRKERLDKHSMPYDEL